MVLWKLNSGKEYKCVPVPRWWTMSHFSFSETSMEDLAMHLDWKTLSVPELNAYIMCESLIC